MAGERSLTHRVLSPSLAAPGEISRPRRQPSGFCSELSDQVTSTQQVLMCTLTINL